MEFFFFTYFELVKLKVWKNPSLPPGSKKSSRQQFQTNIILRIALQ